MWWDGPFTHAVVKIRFRIRMLFQKNRPLTSPAATKLELQKGYRVSVWGYSHTFSCCSDIVWR